MIGLPISALCLCLHVCLCCIAPVKYFVTCLLLRGAITMKFLILNSLKVTMWVLNFFSFHLSSGPGLTSPGSRRGLVRRISHCVTEIHLWRQLLEL